MIQWIIGIFAFLTLLIVKAIWDEKAYKKRTVRELKKEWGRMIKDEPSYDKMLTIDSYYQTVRDDALDVDDVTWNDLDMEEIYYRLNHTESAMGEEYLYAVLRKPLFSKDVLQERSRLATFFMENEEKRIRIQTSLRKMGKLRNISLHEYINKTVSIDVSDTPRHMIYNMVLLLSLALTFYSPLFGIALTVMVINNVITYYKRKAEIEKYYSVLISILKILYGI
jgi:DNA mismatch repair ATPase MutS